MFLWEPVDASGRLPANIAATFPRAELQSPLVLPRQTLYPRKPAVVNRAILRPRP